MYIKLSIVFFSYSLWLLPITGAAKMIIDPDTSKAIPSFLGTVFLIKGKAQKTRIGEEEKIQVKKGGKIIKGDIVQTADSSFVRVKMSNADKSIITLGPVSVVEFKDSLIGPDKKIRTSVYSFLKGQMRARFDKSSKKNKTTFNVGKNVSMGIRGTELLANFQPDLKDKEISQIALLEGQLDVATKLDNQIHRMIAGDHFIYIEDKVTGDIGRRIKKIDPQLLKKLKDFKNTPFLGYFMNQVGNLEDKGPIQTEKKSKLKSSKKKGTTHTKNSWRKLLKELNKRYKKK